MNFFKNRIFGLDFLRALSLIAVLIAHTGYERIFGFRYGVLAVEYFFVLSGFLVGEMLLREFSEGANTKTLLNFMIKRWFRTLPLYYLILLLKFAFQTPFMGTKIIPYLFFLQNNVGGISFFAVSWTLVIEEWFYLILPFLIFIFFRKGIEAKKFILFSIAVVVIENMARFYMAYYLNRPWGAIVGNFPFRFDSFFIGVFLAFIKLNYKKVYLYMAEAKFFILSFIFAAFVIVLYARSGGAELEENTALWVRTIGFFLISLVLTLMIPFFDQNHRINNLGDKNLIKFILTWISLLSYPAYLIHMDVLRFNFFPDFIRNIYWLHITCIYILIFICSFLLFRYFHHPVTQLRKKFLIK